MQLPSLLRGLRSGLVCVALVGCSTPEVQKPTTDEEPSIADEAEEDVSAPDDDTATGEPDARVDAGNAPRPAPQVDSGVRADSGAGTPVDAGTPTGTADAAVGAADAGSVSTSDGGASGPGVCGGTTPHGCYTPKADNPMGCPPQIFEQSAFYPPFEEWKGCSSPFYEPCNYVKPEGGEANCSCDLGLHWLCTY